MWEVRIPAILLLIPSCSSLPIGWVFSGHLSINGLGGASILLVGADRIRQHAPVGSRMGAPPGAMELEIVSKGGTEEKPTTPILMGI